MTNKLYYDNAIDALYMAQRFGVKYLETTTHKDKWKKL